MIAAAVGARVDVRVFVGTSEERRTYPIVPQGEHAATRGIDHEWNARGTIEQESPEKYLLE